MELSEYEQRKLDEIERALHRDDPGFAGTLNFATMRRHRRLVAAVIVATGLLVLVAGAVLAQGPPLVGAAVSVLGFRGDGGWRRAVPLGATQPSSNCGGQACPPRAGEVVQDGGPVPASFPATRRITPTVTRQ